MPGRSWLVVISPPVVMIVSVWGSDAGRVEDPVDRDCDGRSVFGETDDARRG